VGIPERLEIWHHVRADRERHVLHLMAEFAEQGAGLLVGGHAVRVHDGAFDRGREGAADPEPARLAARIAEERLAGRQRRERIHVTRVVAGHHVKEQGGVRDGPADRTVDRQPEEVRHDRPFGDPAAGRLDPDQPADARRNADGTSAVASLGGRREARGDGRGGTAA
jgi:hypothetical protein